VSDDDKLPAVAVALVNWNRWEDTVACLESFDRLRYPSHPALIVCDNASTNDSVDRIQSWARGRGWTTRVVEHPSEGAARALAGGEERLLIVRNNRNTGFAGGTNAAIRYALGSARRYRYVWVLNTDTTVEPDSLVAVVRALENYPAAASAQSLLTWTREPALLDSAGMQLRRRGGAVDMLHHRPRAELDGLVSRREVIEIFGCCGAAALYRVEALQSVGLFDESLFHTHEDVDLACRLRAEGYLALLVPRSIVHHAGGVSRDRKKKGGMWWIAHRNKLRIVARWYPRALAVPILTLGVLRALIAALRSPDVPFRGWVALSPLLWQEWRRGASNPVRRRILRLGAARTIV
jgi:GT2 family glycosyltransferase